MSSDPTGTTALIFSALLALMLGGYLALTARRMEPRPEDRVDAEIEEGAGEVGFFSPHSWWPISLGLACTVASFGLIFGVWLTLVGALMVLLTAIGLLFEYYVGHTQGAGTIAGGQVEHPGATQPNTKPLPHGSSGSHA